MFVSRATILMVLVVVYTSQGLMGAGAQSANVIYAQVASLLFGFWQDPDKNAVHYM